MREVELLEKAIAALEGLRASLGDDVVNAGVAPLRQKLALLQVEDSPTRRSRTAFPTRAP